MSRRLTASVAAALALLALSAPAEAALVQIDPSYAVQTLPINISTPTTTQMVAGQTGIAIYVTHWDLIAGGTGNATWVYGDNANCVTNQVALTGPYNLTAQAGLSPGNGSGTVLKAPKGKFLCFTSSAAVQYSGSFTFLQSAN